MVDYSELYTEADKAFNKEGFLAYQLSISRATEENNRKKAAGDTELIKIAELDEMWAQTYIQPLADFMGESFVWENKFGKDNITLPRFRPDGTLIKESIRHAPTDKHAARFSGIHWYSRKRGDPKEKDFNAFHHQQLDGTNQFCQTYAMMYLCHRLDHYPTKTPPERFEDYYNYTKQALEFIKETIQSIPPTKPIFNDYWSKKDMIELVDEALEHYHMCVNLPWFDPKNFRN